MGLLATMGLVLLLSKSSLETPAKLEEYNHISHMRIHKRSADPSKQKDDEFIEEKLVEHGQALEHLVKLVQKNEELTRKLFDKLSNSKNAENPDLPESLESGRRSFEQTTLSPADRGEKGNPWCIAAFLCRKKKDPVCGFDSDYGYGKFNDVCHMFEVNCYWQYNFLISPLCHRKLEV